MSTNLADDIDPEDMFADTRMSIGDHIEDLRTHLLRAIKGLVIGMVFAFYPLGPWVLNIITAPVEEQLNRFEKRKFEKDVLLNRERQKDSGRLAQPVVMEMVFLDRTQLAKGLGVKLENLPGAGKKDPEELDKMITWFGAQLKDLDAGHLLPANAIQHADGIRVKVMIPDPEGMNVELQRQALEYRPKRVTAMGITEAFMVYMKVAFITGLTLSSPWVFYHIWAFIAAGLYPNEKKLVNVYMPFSLFLFLAGVLICQFLVMTRAIEAMLWFNEWLGIDADLRLNEWLGFAIMMPVVFGVSFQTPLVMMFMHKIGIVNTAKFREFRRIAWFAMCVFAAIITPSVDPYSMLLLWVPMCGLYELGILLCVYQGEQTTLFDWEEDEKKAGEMVEV